MPIRQLMQFSVPDYGVLAAAGSPWSLNWVIVVVAVPAYIQLIGTEVMMSPFFIAAGEPPNADFDTE